ncbi:MAG: LysR family transcriptional regulator [Clostridia bacterium]|nr:LysR family transcriptional regulator [Clostridia bacterium]
MTLLHLRYFCTVAKHENLNRASKELFVSQPALSKVIRTLEEELGVQLFIRDGRNLRLSDDGSFFYDNIKHSLTILDNTVSSLINKAAVKEIKLCLNSANLFIEEAIAEFRQTHDDVFFVITEGTLAHYPPNASEYDLVVYTADSGLHDAENNRRHILLTERFGICVPDTDPAYALPEVNLADMQDRHFIGTNTYGVNYQFCREAGYTPKMVMVGQQLHGYMKMLEYGTGVSVLPEITLGSYLPSNCRFVPLKGQERTRTIIIEETLLQTQSAHVKEFVAFCIGKARRKMEAVRPAPSANAERQHQCQAPYGCL